MLGAAMSVKTFVGQLAIRMTMVGALLTAAGLTTYHATHWEPNIVNSPPIHMSGR